MRWFSYFILAYLVVGLQIGLAPYVAYHGAAPNLVLLAVVFIAVNAPRDAALLGCFMLGFLQDLVTQQQPGLFAFSYGLVALLVLNTQQVVYKDHPLTHFSLALAAGLLTAAIILAHGWLRPPVLKPVDGRGVRPGATTELTRVLYTALLAPIVLGVLKRAKTLFGFHGGRRKGRAW
ncbi:MAG TPA: rod shape-determining protein MreD [Tepidisphaeraceae bacterium]|jgi:rod shape-determining protein MreD